MNLHERQSLPKLWLRSFSVTNKALPTLLVVLMGYLALGFMMYLVLKSMAMPLAMLFVRLFMTTGNKFVLIFNGLMLGVAVWGIWQLYSKFFVTLGSRWAGQVAEKKSAFLLETTVDSIKPAFFSVLSGILVALPALAIYIPTYFLLQGANPSVVKMVDWMLRILLFFALYIRLTYAQPFIMLKNRGPLEGIVQSWRMTRGAKYVDTLLMWLMFAGTCLLYTVLAVGVLRGLRTVIPLYFAGLFDISQTWIGWAVLALLLGLIAFFCFCQVWIFLLLTFLNRYYTNDGGAFDTDVRSRPDITSGYVPLPAVEIPHFEPAPQEKSSTVSAPAVQPATAPAQEGTEMTDMRPLGSFPNRGSDTPAHPAAPKPADVAPQEQPIGLSALDEVEDLQISQSSIHTSDQDSHDISEHLNQVYTPSQDNTIQYGDEDRMPTILFDDEMAKELEKTARQFPANPNKDTDTPPDPGSIKISK